MSLAVRNWLVVLGLLVLAVQCFRCGELGRPRHIGVRVLLALRHVKEHVSYSDENGEMTWL